jgi:hypothetical protein
MSVFAAKSIFFCAWPPRDVDEVFTSSTINPSTASYRKRLTIHETSGAVVAGVPPAKGKTAAASGAAEPALSLSNRSVAILSEWSEWSVLGSRDIDGQTREGERAGAKESMG